ncbi:hypothetical protein PSDVSF_12270 [Pseudodesulfovibrio sediminis]|uniref:Uncharacterized protein n=1 Tax=Pseudodesulfovibrio sediminis TaxID=2810563 RepID=A0ABM7P519_9BACT|nr:hypothetical protein PSDVSF_12270 [Pseudodesulfovibrio sediminis]
MQLGLWADSTPYVVTVNFSYADTPSISTAPCPDTRGIVSV